MSSQKGTYYFGDGQLVASLGGDQSFPHAFSNRIVGPAPLETFVFSAYFHFDGHSRFHL